MDPRPPIGAAMAFSSTQVSVGPVPVLLHTADADPYTIILRNRSSNVAIYAGGSAGGSAVSQYSGYQLDAGESVSFALAAGESIWAVVASSSARVDVIVAQFA